MVTKRSINLSSLSSGVDLISQFRNALTPQKPWESIIDFATHKSFCGLKLYPRQHTFLKLAYLETESMTQYDLDVIEEWRKGWSQPQPEGTQSDIWYRIDYLKKNGYTHFPHIQNVLGRRASKGMLGGILGAERLAYFYSLGDFQSHFGLPPGKDAYLSVIATNTVQAKKFLFADIRQAVEQCRYLETAISTSNEYSLSLRTEADKRLIAESERRGIRLDHEVATVRAIAASSTSSSGRGGVGFANFYDEFAHMQAGTGGPRTSEEVYEAYQPSLDQFGREALTYIPSSPYTKVGKFYDLYKSGSILLDSFLNDEGKKASSDYVKDDTLAEDLESEEKVAYADPEMLIVQLPSWALYRDWQHAYSLVGTTFKGAIQYEPLRNGVIENERMVRLERRDPEKFKVERRAQFAEVINSYLEPQKVDEIFEPLWDGRVLSEQNSGSHALVYHGHCDPSKTNANFGLAIGHLEECPEPDEYGNKWKHVVFDFLWAYQPKDFPDHTVDYIKIEKDIENLISNFPTMELFTADHWNSILLLSELRRFTQLKKLGTRVEEVKFTSSRNQDTAEAFKAAMNLGWVHAYRDSLFNDGQGSLLETELKFLTEQNGKVQKQSVGPCTTKDLADCVMEVTVRLLGEQLGSWNREKLSSPPVSGLQGGYPTPGSFSNDTLSSLKSLSQRRTPGMGRASRGRRGY